VLGLMVAILLPGSSYLFFWPILFQLACFCGSMFLTNSWMRLALLALSALPTLLLITPLVRQFYVALGSAAVAVPMTVLALECAALSLQLEALIGVRSCYKNSRA
jgi:hypothetical protein